MFTHPVCKIALGDIVGNEIGCAFIPETVVKKIHHNFMIGDDGLFHTRLVRVEAWVKTRDSGQGREGVNLR